MSLANTDDHIIETALSLNMKITDIEEIVDEISEDNVLSLIITDDHILEVASAINMEITDIDSMKKYIKEKSMDVCREDGATHLCIFLERIINEAYEDSEGCIRRRIN